MIYVVWSNYDGATVSEFEETKEAELFVAEVVAKEAAADYGTKLMAIIEGKQMSYKPVEMVAKVKIFPNLNECSFPTEGMP